MKNEKCPGNSEISTIVGGNKVMEEIYEIIKDIGGQGKCSAHETKQY